MAEKQVTIKDIAKVLGVSVSTVSRALSDSWDIHPDTRDMVLEAAKRLNYKPNINAVRLQNRRTKTIGVVVPEFQHSFFPQVIIGIQEVLDEAGFQLLIVQSNESFETEERNLRLLERNMVEGIILSVTRHGENTRLYQELIDSGISFVFFNRTPDAIDAPKVIIDDYNMAKVAVRHLVESGYRCIAHITGPDNIKLSSLRKQGYLDTLREAELDVDERYIVTGGVMQDQGIDAMNRMLTLDPLPDAIFCFNDPLAIGAMRVIKSKGLKIPGDIAVCGFSESRSASIVDPPLTSIAQPTYLMGRTAAHLLLEKLNRKGISKQPNKTICLESQLNIRASTIPSG